MPGVNDKMVSDNTTPRQPTSLQGLLRLAMEATQAEATAGDAQLSQIDEEVSNEQPSFISVPFNFLFRGNVSWKRH